MQAPPLVSADWVCVHAQRKLGDLSSNAAPSFQPMGLHYFAGSEARPPLMAVEIWWNTCLGFHAVVLPERPTHGRVHKIPLFTP